MIEKRIQRIIQEIKDQKRKDLDKFYEGSVDLKFKEARKIIAEGYPNVFLLHTSSESLYFIKVNQKGDRIEQCIFGCEKKDYI